MYDLHVTDPDRLYALGERISSMLVTDVIHDPSLVVRGYEVLERLTKQLEPDVRLLQKQGDLEQLAGSVRFDVTSPLRKIKDAVEDIRKGRDYNAMEVAAAFGLVIQAHIGIRSRAREIRGEADLGMPAGPQ